MANTDGSTPVWMIAAAWIFVGIPLLMGVSQTMMNAMQLFH